MWAFFYLWHPAGCYFSINACLVLAICCTLVLLTIMRCLFFAIVAIIFFSCGRTADEKETPAGIDTVPVRHAAAKTSAPNSDTLYINTKAAVFYAPDSARIDRAKKDAGEDAFYTGADDYVYYIGKCREYFDSVKLKTVYAKDKKYIRFIKDDDTRIYVKLDTLPELWGIYLFEPKKDPKLVDMLAIEDEYNNYYKQ